MPPTFPVLYAGDVGELSQRLAVAFYDAPSRDMLVIGVGGSHGKTTVSWLIRGMLEEMDQVCMFLCYAMQSFCSHLVIYREPYPSL